MKTTIVAVTCALCAAACANNKPAQDQSNAVGETQPPSSESATTSGNMGTQPGATGNPTGSTSMMGNGTTGNSGYGSNGTATGSTYPGATGTNPGSAGNMGSSNTGATTTPGSSSTNQGMTNTPGTSSTSTGTTNDQGTTNNQGTTIPDNTATTTRSATAAPQQGTSKAELAITATIHRDVMHDRTLSTTAKNVKIITSGTTVTLRGSVKSDTERTTIENLARQTPGVTDVDDQLEVKGTK